MDGTGDLLAAFAAQLPTSDVGVVVQYPAFERLSRCELLRHIREFLPPNEDYILVAESFSGQFGIEIAAAMPPGLRALILVNTFAACPIGLIQRFIGFTFGELFFRMPPPSWAIRRYLIGASPNEQANDVKRSIAKVNGSVLASRFRMVLKYDVRTMLRTLQTPTLVISGDQDSLVSQAQSEQIVAGISSAKLVRVNAPHLALFINPTETLRAIRDFISGSESTKTLNANQSET
jgi:pimeloyl-ACP methyl ester carboxylesterase